MVAVEYDEFRAQLSGARRGHGGMHAVTTSRVAGRSDDPTTTGPAHHHRLANEVGPVKEFDGHEEGVHVDVEDRAVTLLPGRGRHVATTTMSARVVPSMR